MKIHGNISKVIKIYNKNIAKTNKAQSIKGKKDKIILSKNAQSYNFATNIINQLPDIRYEKIKEIEKQYNEGTYNITGKEIAAKMLSRNIDKKV